MLDPLATDRPGVCDGRLPIHHLWFLAVPDLQALDLVGPFEVFTTANQVADRLERGGLRYRPRVVAARTGVATTESGLGVVVEAAPPDEPGRAGGPRIGTLVVPGGRGARAAVHDSELVTMTAELAGRADRLATVCTGSFLAAATGELDGYRVATHWAWASELAAAYPEVEVDRESLHVQDGRVWSSAGVTAGMDLALALVEQDHDAEVAQLVARWLVLHLRRPGGQSQFAAPVWQRLSPLPPVRRAQELVAADPGGDHRLERLASRVGVSTRHLSRLFLAEVGEAPGRYVERVRVETARHHLESGPLDGGLDAVARACGFGSAETLRRAFHRRLGLAPDEYRRRFRLPTDRAADAAPS
jgi:transcriptional regulator GlxA family with amidase domain